MRTFRLLALIAAAALGCGVRPTRAPVALGRPGPDPGSRTFLVDDMLFVASDWPSRVEGRSFIIEEDGACRKKHFIGPSTKAWTNLRRGWVPATTCTYLEIVHGRGVSASRAECQQHLDDEVSFGAFRYASEAKRTKVSIAGRPATQDDLLYNSGSEAMRFVTYGLCWGNDVYAITIGGLDANWDEVERLRARMIASFRWVDPGEAAAATAGASATTGR